MATTRDDAERVQAESAAAWAAWLAANHTRTTGVWLVTWRARSGRPVLAYEDAVIEALRYGWIDSTGGSVDAERTELWFAPRKRGSGSSMPPGRTVPGPCWTMSRTSSCPMT